jgi:hypothetical protein|tara:strand:+ start:121 stop:390 length:270 start_codon:yes stop_codon:yes gene_type:complete
MDLTIHVPKLISLNNSEMREVTLAYLEKMTDGYGIEPRPGHNRELWVYEWEDNLGSGILPITTYLRPANEFEKALLLVTREIRNKKEER